MATSILAAAHADRHPSKGVPTPADTQDVCIDLPGEDIRCYVHKRKLQITLRKHRDVIFDIQLFQGMQYSVEADQSDFYNVRDKKIVLAAKKQKVSFTDGERIHLHVGRNFAGQLILKANGKVMGRYTPNTLDGQRYDDDPATKPAPLMVVIKNELGSASLMTSGKKKEGGTNAAADPWGLGSWTVKPTLGEYGVDQFTLYGRGLPVIPVQEQHPTVVVVDGNDKGMPQRLLDHFAAGGGKSGLADVDLNEVATRNWIYGQVAGAAAYMGDNWNWLRHSINRQADGAFRLVGAKVAYVRGKVRIYFTGYNASNPIFGQGGHGTGNAKILQIYAGMGKAASSFKATAQAVAGTFKGNALVSFVFGSMTSWMEWQSDAQKDGYDFAAALLTGLVKALVAAAITALLVAAVLAVVIVVAKVVVAALVVGLLTVAVGFAVGYAIEAADKKIGKALKGPTNSDGTAASVAPWLRGAGEWLSEAWGSLAAKFPKDYQPWAAM